MIEGLEQKLEPFSNGVVNKQANNYDGNNANGNSRKKRADLLNSDGRIDLKNHNFGLGNNGGGLGLSDICGMGFGGLGEIFLLRFFLSLFCQRNLTLTMRIALDIWKVGMN